MTPTAPHSVTCACCGSSNIQQLPAVYEQSLASYQIKGYSLRGGFFAGSVRQQTPLGKRAAPPQQIDPGLRWIAFALEGTFGTFVILTLIAKVTQIPIPVYWAIMITIGIWCWALPKVPHENKTYLQRVYNPAKRKWQRSYYCHHCGAIFDPSPDLN